MKRAQIEEARRHAAELHDEEEQAKLALLPPNENDFSVTAHLMRKHLERMNESLAETAKHARNAVLIQRLVVVPKLNTMDVLNELRLATHFTKELGEETDKTGNSIPSFRQWKFSKKTPTAMAFAFAKLHHRRQSARQRNCSIRMSVWCGSAGLTHTSR